MSYIKAYFTCLLKMGCMLGLIHLLLCFWVGEAHSFYFIYLCLFSSLAGPLSVVLNEN